MTLRLRDGRLPAVRAMPHEAPPQAAVDLQYIYIQHYNPRAPDPTIAELDQ